MSQQQHKLQLQREGRLQLALQAYNTSQFRSHQAAAAAFNVDQRRLSERASETPFRLNVRANCHKLTATEEQTIV